MSFVDHLEELRKRLIICLIAVAIASCLTYAFVKPIMQVMTQPLGGKLIFTAPMEVFYTYFLVALFSGLFLSSPIVLFQVWRFVSVALTKRERRYILWYGFFSFILFAVGIAFAFFVTLPVALRFFLSFASDNLQPMISISKYIYFAGTLLLSFGLIFEMPVVILLLTELGIIKPNLLQRQRKYAVLIIVITAALLTPTPDIFNLLLMVIPMLVLFELTIWLTVLVAYRKRKQADREGIST